MCMMGPGKSCVEDNFVLGKSQNRVIGKTMLDKIVLGKTILDKKSEASSLATVFFLPNAP